MKKLGTEKGFTLLELSIAMAGLALLTASAIPYFIRQAEVAAAQKTVNEISTIQEAAKWYYLENVAWPSSVGSLKSARYLSQQWSASNPWGNGYSISSSARTFTVSTAVPGSVKGVLTRALPGVSSWSNGGSQFVSSVIPAPAHEANLTEVRNAANTALNMARQSALPPNGPIHAFSGRGGGTPPCPPGEIMIGIHAGGGTNAVGFHCQSVTRTGSSSGNQLGALEGQIRQLESEYRQLVARNQQLQVIYNRLAEEYRAFREWLDDRSND